MDGSPPPHPSYNLFNLTHFTSTLPALSLPTISVPYATSAFDSQPPEIAAQADQWLDNPTEDIDNMMQQWLSQADMSWMPSSDEGQFIRKPVQSLSMPRKPLGDISNTQPARAGSMPPPPAKPKVVPTHTPASTTASAPAPHAQPQPQQNMPPPQPVKTFSKKKRAATQEGQAINGAPDQGKKKMLKLKSKNQQPVQQEEDILESVEGKRFGVLIAHIFEVHDASVQDEGAQREAFVSYEVLNELWTETAKLKANKSLSRIPTETLSRLVHIMDSYVRKGNNLKIADEDEERSEKIKEIIIQHSFVAALVIIHIFAADNIEKSLIVEEVLENMLQFCKFCVAHNIIPAFDPLTESKKAKGKKAMDYAKRIVGLLCLYLDVLNEFASKEPLADVMVLDICSITVPTFFMEGGSELQLHSLNVVRTIFSRYEKHRTLILEDIFNSLAKLPKTKRALRTYRLSEDNKSIQMVSALVLQLIQCCPSLVKLAVTGGKKGIDLDPQAAADTQQQANGDSAVTISDANSYEAAVACAHAFMKSFMAKCSTREEDNDYRQILTNFVEDLLTTINLPEWPASQVLLRVLSGILLKNMKKDSKESTVLKTFSIDLLGSVAAKVKKEMTLAQQWKEVLPGTAGDVEDASCICNSTQYTGQFMLDCDECHKWFHGACVGVLPENVPPQWFCDTCLVRRKVRSRRKAAKLGSATSIDMSQSSMDLSVDEPADADKSVDVSADEEREDIEIDVMRLMLLNYLRERSHTDSSVVYSRQFFISQWCHGEADEDRVQDYKSQWEINSKRSVELAERNERLLSRDGVMKIVRFLATKGSLFLSFDSLLNQILTLMNESLTTFRAKGLKALTAVLEADANTLGDTRVEQAVKGRFWDNAISVRSAAVDLVGKYVLERPEFASQYYPMIAERILDKGVSVRKRVVKILSDMCLGQPHHSLIPTICKKLVTRIGDEDESIKDTVLATFQSLWFGPLPKKQEDATVTEASKALDMPARVDQIIEVVTSGSQWFVDLLISLFTKEEKETKKPIHAICQQMAGCIVDRIFTVDEEGSAEAEIKQSQTKRVVKSMPAILNALHLFCQAAPELLVPHIRSLQPYMKLLTNDGSEHLTARSVIGIVESVAPLLEHPEPTFLETIEKDLEQVIYNIHLGGALAWSVLAAAAKCLVTVVQKLTGHHEQVMAIVNRFQTYLDRCRSMCTQPEHLTASRVASAGRALYCLGHICRYYQANPSDSFTASPFSKDPVLNNTFNLLMLYAQSVSPELQLRSIQAIGSIFVRAPELMLKPQVQSIIKKSLNSDSQDVRLQMLLNIAEFLAAEEAKALSGASTKSKPKKTKKPKQEKKPKRDEDELNLDDSQDLNESLDASSHELFVEMDNSDSGVSNTIAQTFLKEILEQSLDSHARVRAAALNALSLIQRQGLMHPLQCVPHLVALETDRELGIADKAHRLLTTINEKFPTFLHNRFIDGIKLSYTYQKNLYGSCSVLAQNSEMPVSVLAQLYTLFSDKRTTRNFFLSNIIRLFEKCTSSEETDVDFFQYLAELILSLPYSYTDEVLCIIYHINKTASYVGGIALAALESFFKKSKASDQPATIAEDKIKISSMIMILIMLKQTLKRIYKLSDSRCKAYSPAETVKAREGKITEAPAIELALKSSPFEGIPHEFDVEDLPSLRKHYKEFKRIMREDESDFDLKESNNKKKRSPTGKGRGRRTKEAELEEVESNGDENDDSHEDKSPVAQRTRGKAGGGRGRKRKSDTSEESEDASYDEGTRGKAKRKAPARKTKRKRIGEEDDSNDSDFVA